MPTQEDRPVPRPRLDRTVVWALALLLAAAPLALVLLTVIASGVSLTGVDPSSPAGAERLSSLNWLFLVLASLPLVGSAALGLRAWVRRRRVSGIVITVLASLALLAFLLGPLLVR